MKGFQVCYTLCYVIYYVSCYMLQYMLRCMLHLVFHYNVMLSIFFSYYVSCYFVLYLHVTFCRIISRMFPFFLHSYILTMLSIMPFTVTSLISEHLISGQIYIYPSKKSVIKTKGGHWTQSLKVSVNRRVVYIIIVSLLR